MTTSFPRLIARAALGVVFTALVVLNVHGQASSARYIPTEQEKADLRVSGIISKAETHFKNGKLELENSRREQARDQFDKAIDTILDSGLDVRSYPKLREYFVQLTERIYREEVPLQQVTPQPVQNVQVAMNIGQETPPPPQQSQIGFRDQKFEPSPLDELSKLVLTPEETNVTPEDVGEIEVAKSAVDFNFETHPLIQQFINYYQGRGRSTMESGLRRSGRFMKMARQIFREEGVPEDIVWLGQVESAWRPTAMSWAAASGLWQFIPGTGKTYGLRQTAWVDERNSYEKATRASARYLKDLAKHFGGDWNLAMAAYNTGQGNIDRAISRSGGSANFWNIYPYIAQETKNYVPNILATILIAKNPEKYGFRNIQREAPMAYDIVQVPNATNLQLIAQATDTSVAYLRELNPELRQATTPRGETYQVRIPGGKAKQFVAILNRIPGNARESAAIVAVAPGEDLEAVARRTGISVAQLQQMNGGADKALGNKIVVPRSMVQQTAIVRAKPATETPVAGGVAMKVRARAGDTVSKIAERFNFSADVVARLNGVAADAELQSGQEIKLPSVSAAPSRRRGR